MLEGSLPSKEVETQFTYTSLQCDSTKNDAARHSITSYVCAFVPTPDRKNVLLLRKKTPVWQAGRLNGVGGKIEKSDLDLAIKVADTVTASQFAMQREWKEETGLSSDIKKWREVVSMSGEAISEGTGEAHLWIVHFFTYMSPEEFNFCSLVDSYLTKFNDIGEMFYLITIESLHERKDIINNLRWLVHLCLYCNNTVPGGVNLPISVCDIKEF